jgi:tetratricopeptide (TPR) repeat protein
MARTNENNTILSTEENTQLQHLLDRYQELAQQIRTTTTQAQAEAALNDITSLSSKVQIALLKALAKEQTSESADLLTALNAFSPNKEIRKEARRSLLRLDAAKIYSSWTPPITQASAIQVNVNHAPRFWRGLVTQSREEGEVQLALFWEQGYDYSEIRFLSFLLDYWQDGVKDIFVEATNRKAAERRIEDMRLGLPDAHVLDCTLAEAKRLIEEALSVNKWRGNDPNKEFRNRLPTINQLILQAENIGDDSGRTFINPDLENQEVVINFLGAWVLGDYGAAYDLNSEGSNIHNRLSRDEWLERHRAWYDEAQPRRLELGFIHERERSQSALWLPSTGIARPSSKKDIEVGWSVEIVDTQLAGTLRELPMGTAIYKETGRHWYWANYTLEQTRDGWRIQQFTDEGANVQGLSVTELQNRIQEYENAIEQKLQQRNEDMNALMQELSWRAIQLLHFYDALLAKLPLDRQVNEEAYGRSVFVGSPERTLVYLERLIQRFPENRADLQRRLGSTFAELAFRYERAEMPERKDLFMQRAEETLREALVAQNNALGHLLLGEFFLSMNREDEAEAEFREAQSMTITLDEEKALEAGLGNLAMRREKPAEALPHYQRVAELDSNYPGIWFNIGFAQRLLNNLVDAEQAYQRAIEIEAQDIRPYSELIAIYTNRQDAEKARAIAQQGIQANPASAHLHALYASVLMELDERRAAERELQMAEQLDPSLEIVQIVRSLMTKNPQRR